MTENGNSYMQVITGPDGEPLVVLRLRDLITIVEMLLAEKPTPSARGGHIEKNFSNFLTDLDSRSLGVRVAEEAFSFSKNNIDAVNYFQTSRTDINEIVEAVMVLSRDVGALVDNGDGDDVALADAKARVAEGRDEIVSAETADRLIGGEAPLRVWREYRNFTQKALAETAGISQAMISQIESGKRKGDVDVLKAIADALNVTLDDLVA